MSKHKKRRRGKNRHGHNRHGDEHVRAKKKKMIHHDWRFWVAMMLTLLAIGAYVMSLDESWRPAGVDEAEVPAAAE